MNSKESIVHSLVLAGVSKAWQSPVYRAQSQRERVVSYTAMAKSYCGHRV